MGASFNKVIILGNLGRDPEVRFMPNGKAVCNFSVATSEKYNGEEHTQWHNISAFDKTAELCGQYLKKGRSVLIEGKLKYRKYADKNGVEKMATDIIADRVQFLGGKGDRQETAQNGGFEPLETSNNAPADDSSVPF